MSKKTILLLSDDIRTFSGVATVSKKLIEGTVKDYNWIQLGAVTKTPDDGKLFDLSDEYRTKTNIKDASVLVYASSGYGTAEKIRALLSKHKIDAIVHYTDPRYWEWLYNMEYEIRSQGIPILYYHVWDNYPAPKYNIPFYKSCDNIMTISRQTHSIVKELLGDECCDINEKEDNKILLSYVPHGIDPREFKPLSVDEPGDFITLSDDSIITEFDEMDKLKKSIFGNASYEYIILFNNRNILRKNPADVIVAYNKFAESLSIEDRAKVALLLHTAPIDQFGTNLYKVTQDLCKYPVYFSARRLETKYMNMLYNIASVTINIASAEGFGLSTAESIMAGTPVIVNVTGGLQDQVNFVNEDGSTIENFTTNHDRKYGDNHGEWAYTIFPTTVLTGSVRTPYIYDDHASIDNIANTMKVVFDDRDSLKSNGLLGRQWMIDNKLNFNYMTESFKNSIDTTLDNYKGIDKIRLIKINAGVV